MVQDSDSRKRRRIRLRLFGDFSRWFRGPIPTKVTWIAFDNPVQILDASIHDQMQLVDHDTFILQLKKLFEKAGNGTIWLTHKRLTYGADIEEVTDTTEYPCLLRASDGAKTKFSTRVDASQLDKFYSAYGSLLKTAMTTLRKRDKKREKVRQEDATKRKKKMTEQIEIAGPKRGNGRRQRQRKVKALSKQQGSQKKFKEREEAQQKAHMDVSQ